MKAAPAIALERRREATRKFARKLDVLEELLGDGLLDRFPKRVSVSSFANWEDEDLGVQPVSRSVVYEDAPEYVRLRRRMETLLERLIVLRSKKGKKQNVESALRVKLADAQARLQEYVDQYSTARAALVEAQAEIERLKHLVSRQAEKLARVVPLRGVDNHSSAEK